MSKFSSERKRKLETERISILRTLKSSSSCSNLQSGPWRRMRLQQCSRLAISLVSLPSSAVTEKSQEPPGAERAELPRKPLVPCSLCRRPSSLGRQISFVLTRNSESLTESFFPPGRLLRQLETVTHPACAGQPQWGLLGSPKSSQKETKASSSMGFGKPMSKAVLGPEAMISG